MDNFEPGLYVVSTPIGNLDDLSPRAAALLAKATLVAAEDTRTSAVVLRRAGSSARTLSLTEHNVMQRAARLLEAAKDEIVALLSDAGTPVISDPGARLVAAAHDSGVPVRVIPGPSALTAAIAASGMPGSDVHFLGFLPRAKGERLQALERAASTATVLVLFESPARLAATLREISELLGDPVVAVSRELTKLHEETVRGSVSSLVERFERTRGECTVVVLVPERQPGDRRELEAYMAEMQRAGARRSAAAAEAARRFHLTREFAYDAWPGAPET